MMRINGRSASPLCCTAVGIRYSGLTIITMVSVLAGLLAACAEPDAVWVTDEMLLNAKTDKYNWLSHAHDYTSQRYSEQDQVNQDNIGDLTPCWSFRYHQGAARGKQESSPVVVNGIIYLTGAANRIYAIDGRTGKELWHRVEHLPPDARGCCGPMNRGAAVYEDKVYWVTYDNRLFCLDALTGETVWMTKVVDHAHGASSTAAPIVVKGLVQIGIAGAGAEDGRGFVDAYDARTGERVWRHYTVPLPGEPGSETWGDHRPQGGSPWGNPGSYDPELNLVYWSADAPTPNYNGDIRPGDNLFTNSILALDADTGEQVWYFQVIPHGVWDYDCIAENVLVDIEIDGRMRKVLYQANRGGFFVVLDRATGEFLHGGQYIKKQTWAKGLDATGRPIINEDRVPKNGMEPVLVYPDIGGGKNWPPSAYSPRTGYAYFYSSEGAGVYGPPKLTYENGRARYRGGWMVDHPRDLKWNRFIAVDVATAKTVWEVIPASGIGAGVLTTAGGLVFVGDYSGHLLAFHESTGEVLWKFNTGGSISSPPITYTIDGVQHIAVASGTNTFYCFSLFSN